MFLGILLDLQSDGIKFFSKVIFFIDPQSMFLESLIWEIMSRDQKT